MLDRLVRIPAPEVADIAVVGASYPTSTSLYQSMNAVIHCTKLKTPIAREEGRVILISLFDEVVSGTNFFKLVSQSTSPEHVLKTFSQRDVFVHDQWMAQLWVASLLHANVMIVSNGLDESVVKGMLAIKASSPREGLEKSI